MSMSIAVRANCFDASALVKLYTPESGSEIIGPYFNGESTKYTTPFCFYETLSTLKVKWLRDAITKAQYLEAARRLTAWYGASSRGIDDLDFAAHTTFADAKRIVEHTSLDLSDAFQILSVKSGFYGRLAGDSKTVLVTADKGLADAARSEGLRVWYFMEEPAPYPCAEVGNAT